MKYNFAQCFERLLPRYGDKEALVNLERNRRFTFSELHRLGNQATHMMRQTLGLGRGDHYFCILENDNLSLLHLWTSLKGEATPCWTNYRDSVEEHLRQIELVQPKVVFLETARLGDYRELAVRGDMTIVCMDPMTEPVKNVVCFWDLLEGVSDLSATVEHEDREDTVLLRFTGGTTGAGKCAQYTVDNWVYSSDQYGVFSEPLLDANSRFLHITPLSHGSGMQVFATFLRGGCAVTMNTPNLSDWCRHVEQEQINVSMMVPTMMYRLLEIEQTDQHDLSSLDTLFYGAAPIAASKLKLLKTRFGSIFVQSYAATENLGMVSFLSRADHDVSDGEEHLQSCGKPTVGVDVLLLDDKGNPAPIGEPGEMWLRSRSTINGYFKNPEATATEFKEGYWRTGDLARMDARGYLYIVDRLKDMIISGGFNVYASEVEAVMNSHPGVYMSVVVGIPHDDWGEAVHAEVMLRDGWHDIEEELVQYARKNLSSYKAPKSIVIVEELPVSAVGKVLRRQVKNKYWQTTGRLIN